MVHKYAVPTRPGPFQLPLGRGSRVLSCGLDAMGEPSLWAEVDDDDARPEARLLFVEWTGRGLVHVDRSHLVWVGTVVLPDRGLVLHVWEGST